MHIRSLVLTLLLLITTASAQTARHSAQGGSAEDQLRQLWTDWAKAFRAHDIKEVMRVYAPTDELVAYDIVAPLQYRGAGAYRKDYIEFMNQYDGPIDIEFRDIHVLTAGDVGVLFALEHLRAKLKSGGTQDLWLRATSAARKINGKWLIVHDHISVPADFASGKAMLDLKP
jgi:ketosteroid isomerase-like protein